MRSLRNLLTITVLLVASFATVSAEDFGRPAFRDVWQRTDYPVQQNATERSWIWGPQPFTPVLQEWYLDSPESRRAVQYLDKSRMELNQNVPPDSQWYVTNGLLVRDMIEGQVQVGDANFISLLSPAIPVAGDPDNTFPTYLDLRRITATVPALQPGEHVIQQFTPQGFTDLPQYANDPATEIVQVERDYGIPRVFWDFMNQGGLVYTNGNFNQAAELFDWRYVTGFPLADAYWTQVQVGGVEQDVMFQPFERRILTYTPGNPAQFQVEMGNVGQHYYRWRYETLFPEGQSAIITSLADRAVTVTSPLQVQGFEAGSAFEAQIAVQLETADGNLLAEELTLVQRPDIGMTGPFSATLTFDAPQADTPGEVQIVTTSARTGEEIVLADQEVTILGTADESPVPEDAPVEQVRQDLAARLSIDPDIITVVRVEAVEWANSAFECPAPDQAFAPVLTPGYQIILEARGEQYDYRTDRQGNFILCVGGDPAPPINDDEDDEEDTNGAEMQVVLPEEDATVVLPLHIQARLRDSAAQEITARLVWEDGTELERTIEVIESWVIGSLDWTEPTPPDLATQPAMLELRTPEGNLLATHDVTVLNLDDPAVQVVDLYWLLDERLEAEQRPVIDVVTIGTVTLEELLWGPGPRNFAGFSTAIPTPEEVLNYPDREADWGPRVTLRSLTIEDGVATADFSQELRAYGGGSARVEDIREQITQTLLQFPTVDEVIIAVEGETEGVLQP